MWLPANIIQDVDDVARIYYINAEETKRWNANRREGELRMLTGWCWSSKKSNSQHRYGFKTITVAYRDAWYELVQQNVTPTLRLIRGKVA